MDETSKTLEKITNTYIDSYKNDMNKMGVKDAEIEPKATQSLEAIYEIISELVKNGNAYEIDEGIYFDTAKDKEYLSLSRQYIDETKARVEQNSQKKDPTDFALWKFSDTNPTFNSPFGKGRPGWHIECSAMIKKHLAASGEYQIDIHAGGADLLFPHHENEAAQTRCASGQTLAKYWMHNGFVNTNGVKMSKSLGNSFFVKDALRVYDGEVLRFYLLSTHYRADFNFKEDDLLASKVRLDKLYRLKKRVNESQNQTIHVESSFKDEFLEGLNDDLNISKALAVVDEMVTFANEKLDNEPKNKALKEQICANIDYIVHVLNIGSKNPLEYFQIGVSEDEKSIIEKKILLRNDAKKSKDFALADKLRDELKELGIALMDTPSGTTWEKI